MCEKYFVCLFADFGQNYDHTPSFCQTKYYMAPFLKIMDSSLNPLVMCVTILKIMRDKIWSIGLQLSRQYLCFTNNTQHNFIYKEKLKIPATTSKSSQ